MSDTIRLELPMPPSVNNMFVNGKNGRGRFASPAYKGWRAEAGWMVKQQIRGRKIDGPYKLDIALVKPHRGRLDLDNRLKAAIDLLVHLQVTPDDSLLRKITAEWVEVGPPCFVTVSSCDGEAAP